MKAKQSSCGCDCVNIFDDILKRLSDLELMHIDVKDCMAGIMYQVQMRRDSAEITDPNERVNKWVKEKM